MFELLAFYFLVKEPYLANPSDIILHSPTIISLKQVSVNASYGPKEFSIYIANSLNS